MTSSAHDNARVFSTQRPVDEQGLLSRICVSAPYFALRGLSYGDGWFRASAVADLPLGPELGPMGSAELSRHSAIAGLCCAALAQDDDRRRFYLAQRAEYTSFPSARSYGSQVAFAAQLRSLNKRSASASIVATAEGEPLALLEVDYTILTAYAFERLFSNRQRPTTPQTEMDARLPGVRTTGNNRAQLEVAAVPEAACAGHFENYPALPVALLVGQLGETVASLVPSRRLRSMRVSVNATDLCWAGERVQFGAQRAPSQTTETAAETFDCQVVAEGRRVCSAGFEVVPF